MDNYYEQEINVHEFTQETEYEREEAEKFTKANRRTVWINRILGGFLLAMLIFIVPVCIKLGFYWIWFFVPTCVLLALGGIFEEMD